jgi:formate hydrogenlyase subunit 6/NADH:ubiquinone oxidoreductase subunit I
MLNTLKNRFEQGCRTTRYPKEKIALWERYRGMPQINRDASADLVCQCAEACPQDAIHVENRLIDMGRCIFCGTCERVSKGQFVSFTQDFEISVAEKEHLLTDGTISSLADHSKQHFKKLFGRSLQLRQVSAAGCNSCEADLNVLATPFFRSCPVWHQFCGITPALRWHCGDRPHLKEHENRAFEDIRSGTGSKNRNCRRKLHPDRRSLQREP